MPPERTRIRPREIVERVADVLTPSETDFCRAHRKHAPAVPTDAVPRTCPARAIGPFAGPRGEDDRSA
jgi:hypothetical protein